MSADTSTPMKQNMKEFKTKNRATLESARMLRTQKNTLDPAHENQGVLRGQIRKISHITLRKLYENPAQNILDRVALQIILGNNVTICWHSNKNGLKTTNDLTHLKNTR